MSTNKKAKYTYQGINQDISQSKHQPQNYFEAEHVKINATDSQSTGSLMNEKGNELKITLPALL
jgi:ethanolamine utilization cobalamin adenosyltransferase